MPRIESPSEEHHADQGLRPHPPAPARVGCRARLRVPRRRHQRPAGRVGARRRHTALRPVPPRGDVRLPGGRVRQVLRPGRRLRGDLRPRRDPPAQRPVRREARPRAGRRDRGADQPECPGRLVPAGGRPAQPLQGRGLRVLRDGHRPRATAERHRPGHADRLRQAHRDRGHRPGRRAGAGLHTADPRLQDGPVEPGQPRLRARPLPRRRLAGRRRAQRGLEGGGPDRPGSPRRPPRGRGTRGRPRRRGGQGTARQGRPARRPAVRHRVHRPARHPPLVRDDAGLRHAPGGRLQLPVQPVPPGVRPGTRRADRHRPLHGRSALSLRGQSRRRREEHPQGAAAAAEAQEARLLAQEDREGRRALVAGHGGAGRRRRRSPQPGSTSSTPWTPCCRTT